MEECTTYRMKKSSNKEKHNKLETSKKKKQASKYMKQEPTQNKENVEKSK